MLLRSAGVTVATTTIAIATRCLLRAARCILSQETTRQLPTSPVLRFRGLCTPYWQYRRGMRRAARARCCVGAGEGVVAAARRTLRLICAVLPRLCAAAIFAPYCCCGKGGGFASASCAATQALQRRHSGARCRAKAIRCLSLRAAAAATAAAVCVCAP